MTRQQQLSPEQMNALIEQQVVNTRIIALKHAQKLAGIRGVSAGPTADTLIADATKIAAYLIDGLDGLKKKSGLVMTAQMPPPGAFKPGE